MKILLIKNDNKIEEYIYNAISLIGYTYCEIEEPKSNSEEYMARFLMITKEERVDFVFSIGFYPYISLACGALGLTYVSWIIDSFEDSAYDYNLRNRWNLLFTSDYNYYKSIKENCNIAYYPLGYTEDDGVVDLNRKKARDLLVWSDTNGDISYIGDMMDELKDSTKGYVDSMLEQRKNDLCEWPLFERFADYIVSDIEDKYPLISDSFESIQHKYDRLYLFKNLERKYAFPYIHFVSALWKPSSELTLTFEDEDILPEFSCRRISQNEIRKSDYRQLEDYKVLAVFPHIMDGNQITVDMWNMMIKGYFILAPKWINAGRTEEYPFKYFKNKRELFYKAKYYLEKENERRKVSEKIREFALQNGSLSKRIARLFEMIEEK